jgi:hypothetical protein
VRCYCGNPLGLPTSGGQYPDAATRIQPAARPVTDFVVVQSDTNAVVVRPSGSSGEKDRPADPAEQEKAHSLTASFVQGAPTTQAPAPAGATGSAGAGTPSGPGVAATVEPTAEQGILPEPPAGPAPSRVAVDPPGGEPSAVRDPVDPAVTGGDAPVVPPPAGASSGSSGDQGGGAADPVKRNEPVRVIETARRPDDPGLRAVLPER